MTDPRPRPQYGEYAPLPPAAPEGETQPATQSVPQPPAPPAAPQFPAPHSSEIATVDANGQPATPERKRRMWDVMLTSTLLFLGVFDVINGFPAFANFGTILSEGLATQGFDGFSSVEAATEAGAILNIVRVSILVITIVLALLQIQRKRIAFWIPLAGAILAGIAVVGVLVAVLMGDPAFLAYAESQR